jgi:hypothetical protein
MNRFEKNSSHSILLALVACGLFIVAPARQPPAETERVISQALRQSEEYSAKFKDLTAEETKITEIFDYRPTSQIRVFTDSGSVRTELWVERFRHTHPQKIRVQLLHSLSKQG